MVNRSDLIIVKLQSGCYELLPFHLWRYIIKYKLNIFPTYGTNGLFYEEGYRTMGVGSYIVMCAMNVRLPFATMIFIPHGVEFSH